MKKLMMILAAIALIVVLASCGPIKTIPTAVLEMSAGGDDTSLYSFENGTTEGFIPDTVYDPAFKELVNSDFRAYKGNRSLRLYCEYTGQASGIIKQVLGSTSNFAGKTFSAAVWIPKAAFESTPKDAYGSNFYFKTGAATNWTWCQSAWTNLTLAGDVANGVWCLITANADEMTYDTGGGVMAPVTAAQLNDVTEWGFKVAQGDNSANYTGYIYIDSINVE